MDWMKGNEGSSHYARSLRELIMTLIQWVAFTSGLILSKTGLPFADPTCSSFNLRRLQSANSSELSLVLITFTVYCCISWLRRTCHTRRNFYHKQVLVSDEKELFVNTKNLLFTRAWISCFANLWRVKNRVFSINDKQRLICSKFIIRKWP